MAAEGSKRTICIEGSKRSWRTHREAAEDVVVGVVVVRPDPVRAGADALVATVVYVVPDVVAAVARVVRPVAPGVVPRDKSH